MLPTFKEEKEKPIIALSNDVVEVASNELLPVFPRNNSKVDILNYNLNTYWDTDGINKEGLSVSKSFHDEIDKLRIYNTDIQNMGNFINTQDGAKQIYDKYDQFKPVNNKIVFSSSLTNVNKYVVKVSRSKDMSNLDYSIDVDANKREAYLKNPFTGVNYYWQVKALMNDGSSKYSDIFNFEIESKTRTLDVSGVSNTRDLGGYITTSGKKVPEGLIYRGARLDQINEVGLDTLKNNLHIKTDLDLRNLGEGAENPASLQNYKHYPSPYYRGEGTGLQEPDKQVGFGNDIKLFAEPSNYPIYFHCSVGRDRTGTLGQALLLLAGVDIETIYKEYGLSGFSVTGAWPKSQHFLDNASENFKYWNTFSGTTLRDKLINYLENNCGVTIEQINSVTKILTGETTVNINNTISNPDSFGNYHRVEMIQEGVSPKVYFVKDGVSITKPTENISCGSWYTSDSTVWNFSNTVTKSMTLVYKLPKIYTIRIHYANLQLEDQMVQVRSGDNLDLSMYEISGKSLRVYDNTFTEIDSLVATCSCTINLMYI